MIENEGSESHRRIKAERKPFESNRKTRRRSRLRKDGEPSSTGGWSARTPTPSSRVPPSSRVARFERSGRQVVDTPRGIFRKEPDISVRKGNKPGFYEVRGAHRMDVHPDIPFSLLTDFSNTPRIFRSMSRCEVENLGNRCLVTQHMKWRFLFLSGTYSVKILCRLRPELRQLEFELAEPGFMSAFKGLWTSVPLSSSGPTRGCALELRQEIKPAFVPPGPLAHYAERIMVSQVRNVYHDIEIEATREQLRRDTLLEHDRKQKTKTPLKSATR